MSFGDKVGECTRSRTVRIFLLILLVLLCVVGVFLLVRSSDDEENRGLEVIPKLGNGSLIHYKHGDAQTIRLVTRQIDDSLKPYNTTDPNVYKGCNFYNLPPLGKTCNVDLKEFPPCSKDQSFGYTRGQPCVFLKFSRNPAFVPQFYNESKLPETMPDFLKTDIKEFVRTNRHAQMIWVDCAGKTPADVENVGPISYLPRRGFPGFFYPCSSEIKCNEPLVAIQFLRPKYNVQINVACKIYAENVDETIDFELLID